MTCKLAGLKVERAPNPYLRAIVKQLGTIATLKQEGFAQGSILQLLSKIIHLIQDCWSVRQMSLYKMY